MKRIFTAISFTVFSINSFCQIYDFHAADSLLNATYNTLYAGNVVCMVKKNDSVIYYKALGKYDSSSSALIASTSKTFSAAIMLHLVSQRIISLDDTIGKYIPSASQFGHGNCTIQQCFSHTSGWPFSDTPYTYIENPFLTLQQSADSIVKNIPYLFPPGKAFFYGGVSMQVAGSAAEIASGKSWDNLFDSIVVKPCGLANSSYFLSSKNNPRIAGGMISSPSDLLKFASMILHNGKINGVQVIDSAVVQYMWRDETNDVPQIYSPFPFNPPYNPYDNDTIRYGIGDWEDVYNPNTDYVEQISGDGKYGTSVWIDRCRNLTGVVFTLSDFTLVAATNLHLENILRQALGEGCAASGINNVSPNKNFSVYPNPASQNVTITFPKNDSRAGLRIFDELGRLIFAQSFINKNINSVINVSEFSPGIYFMQFNIDNKNIFNQKLVIAR